MTVTDRLTLAQDFATLAHGDQQYGKGLPYKYHLQKVYDELIKVGVDDKDLLIAAWLHDTIEDTCITVQNLEWKFGWRVAAITWAVSDGPGKNRKERKKGAYSKIRMVPDAVIVKLADRIANMRASIGSLEKRNDPRMVTMYLSEAEAFREGLKHSTVSDPLFVNWVIQLQVNLEVLEVKAQGLLLERLPPVGKVPSAW